MGQRLVINFIRGDESIATMYFHWGAYTMASLEILESVHKNVFRDMAPDADKRAVQLALIRFAEHYTGEGYVSDTDRPDFEAQLDEKLAVLQDQLSADVPDVSWQINFIENLRTTGGIDGGKDSDEWKFVAKLFPEETFSGNVNRSHGLVSLSPKGMEAQLGVSEGTVTVDLSETEAIVSNFSLLWLTDESEQNGEEVPVVEINPWEFRLADAGAIADILAPICRGDGKFEYDGECYSVIE